MRTTARISTTIALAGAAFVLAACGPDPGESRSPNTEDDHATGSATPTRTMPATPGIPTTASVQDFCDAFTGDDDAFADVETTGEAADTYEELLEKQREVGTPANMPAETRQVFIDYVHSGANFVAALRRLPEDAPVSEMRTNKEFFEEWGGKLETPEQLQDYSAKHCA